MDVADLLRHRPPVALVVNTGSRRGRDALDGARAVLASRGSAVRVHVVGPGAREDLGTVLDRAVAQRPALLVVGGGDGTVAAAADRVAGTGVVLAVLPMGTANDLARTLELPTDPVVALRAGLAGRVVDVGLGRADGRAFLNVASTGLSVSAAAYAVATVRAYRHHRPFAARLELLDAAGTVERVVELDDLLQLSVGNGRHFGGGNTVAPHASLDDHLLDVHAIGQGRLHEHLSVARLLRSGRLVERDRVVHLTTRAVRVVTDEPRPVNVDGELLPARTSTTYVVEWNAVHVAVPRHSRAARLDEPLRRTS
ncbi:MAG: diacylglycerol kinase [Nocardioides sp.]|nr:diacylglycerol kinase [Nocardioides sp.]